MWTVNYKGFWIHGYVDREQCQVQSPGSTVKVKSLHAAKCFITRQKS